MRKFGLIAAAALILAGFGGWVAATSQALPASQATLERATRRSSFFTAVRRWWS